MQDDIIINEVMRDKSVINDLGYNIQNILKYFFLFEQIYIPNRYISNELSKYVGRMTYLSSMKLYREKKIS